MNESSQLGQFVGISVTCVSLRLSGAASPQSADVLTNERLNEHERAASHPLSAECGSDDTSGMFVGLRNTNTNTAAG